MSETTLRGTIAALALTLITLTFFYFQQEATVVELKTKIKNQDSLVNTIDSLRDENFINGNTIGRYELTLEHLKEVNPKAAAEFENYLSHETE
jgi:hypothetical protein